jgi:hypothetical protein
MWRLQAKRILATIPTTEKMTTLRATGKHSHPATNPIDWKRLDKGISQEVWILRKNGVETNESCQGGQGHPFPEPTIRFAGGRAEGFRVLGIALQHGLKVSELRRIWPIIDGEPTGPEWEMTFHSPRTGPRPIIKANGKATWRWH